MQLQFDASRIVTQKETASVQLTENKIGITRAVLLIAGTENRIGNGDIHTHGDMTN